MIKDYRYKRNNESLVYLLLLIAFILDIIGAKAEILNIMLISLALFFIVVICDHACSPTFPLLSALRP